MAVKVRLMRIGAKGRPFYRVVAVDERAKRTGGYLELLGTYNPLTEPKEIKIDQAKVDAWVKKGAVLSDGYLRIIGKAKPRVARAPKKQKKSEAVSEPAAADAKAAEPVTDAVAEEEAQVQAEAEVNTEVSPETTAEAAVETPADSPDVEMAAAEDAEKGA